jgi:hypothetical protein
MNFRMDPPPIELHHKDFRAVAQNFFTLPVSFVVDLRIAREMQTGDEIVILFDAAEIAFQPNDFEALQDMTVRDFVDVMNLWVGKSGESAQ